MAGLELKAPRLPANNGINTTKSRSPCWAGGRTVRQPGGLCLEFCLRRNRLPKLAKRLPFSKAAFTSRSVDCWQTKTAGEILAPRWGSCKSYPPMRLKQMLGRRLFLIAPSLLFSCANLRSRKVAPRPSASATNPTPNSSSSTVTMSACTALPQQPPTPPRRGYLSVLQLKSSMVLIRGSKGIISHSLSSRLRIS